LIKDLRVNYIAVCTLYIHTSPPSPLSRGEGESSNAPLPPLEEGAGGWRKI